MWVKVYLNNSFYSSMSGTSISVKNCWIFLYCLSISAVEPQRVTLLHSALRCVWFLKCADGIGRRSIFIRPLTLLTMAFLGCTEFWTAGFIRWDAQPTSGLLAFRKNALLVDQLSPRTASTLLKEFPNSDSTNSVHNLCWSAFCLSSSSNGENPSRYSSYLSLLWTELMQIFLENV